MRHYDPSKRKMALQDLARGMRRVDVAEKYGVPTTTVGSWKRTAALNGTWPDIVEQEQEKKNPPPERGREPQKAAGQSGTETIIPPDMHHSPWLGFSAKIEEETE